MPKNGRPYRELLDLTCLAAKQQVGWDFAQKRARGVFTIKKDYRVLVHKQKNWRKKYWDALFQTKCMKPFWIGKHLVLLSNNYTFAKHWEDIFSKPNLFQIKYVQHVIPGFPHVFTTQNSPPQPVSPVRAGCSESRLRQIPLATRGPSPSRRRRRCFQAGAERTGGCGPTRPRRPRSRTG